MAEFEFHTSPAGTVEGVTASFQHEGAARKVLFRRLLADGDDNTKLAKSNRLRRYRTFGLSLAPAKTSGRQVCPKSSPGCRESCIFVSGFAQVFEQINLIRTAKTHLWFEQREMFEKILRQDLDRVRGYAAKLGKKPVVRLNVFSDIPWERVAPWIFEEYCTPIYYDYTKILARVKDPYLPPEYDLTFSRSETNDEEVAEALARKKRVAVVFKIKPRQWRKLRPRVLRVGGRDYRVVDGDRHDLRFLDPEGVVVGLYAKGSGRKDSTGFVLEPRPSGEFVIGRERSFAVSCI